MIYSSRKAFIGSTRLALNAGTKQATTATTSSNAAVVLTAKTSIVPTPYKVECIARPTR